MTGTSGGPRVRRVVAELRDRIALGDYGPDGALESEAELGTRYAVSRITVRSALEALRDEGLVASRKGAGWYVTRSSFGQQLALGTFQHAESALQTAGATVRRRVLEFAFDTCPAPIAGLLGLDPHAEVLRVGLVRHASGSPLDAVTEWVPASLAQQISRTDAEEPGIWATILGHGHRIALVRQSIAAAQATDSVADSLEIPIGAPVLHVRRVAVDGDGTVLALADHRYVGHRFRLDVEFRGWPATNATDPPGVTAVASDDPSNPNHPTNRPDTSDEEPTA